MSTEMDDSQQDRFYSPPKPFRPLHERGFGAKCLKCKEGCEGFDLHFWRKICKNCKCPKEEHDVKEEDDRTRTVIGRLFPDNDNFDHLRRKLPGGLQGDWVDPALGKGAAPKTKVNGSTSANVSVMGGGDGKDIRQEQELGKGQQLTDNSVQASGDGIMYEWTPADCPSELAWLYMQQLPMQLRPVENSEGAQYRRKRMERQLPQHDRDPSVCHNLSEPEIKKLNAFIDTYKRDAIGIGKVVQVTAGGILQPPPAQLTGTGLQGVATATADMKRGARKCEGCREVIQPEQVAVWAERAGPDKLWHPNCFTCSKCNELLVDLVNFYKGGKLYCGRHYADTMKARCAACDELIFAKEYTQAEGQNWHLKHFCCWHCDKPLGGHRYVAKGSNPYCLECYKTQLARVCHTCKQKITADALRLSYEDLDWHATPDCFHCTCCERSLVNEPFMCKQGMIFCSVECKRRVIPPGGGAATQAPQAQHVTPQAPQAQHVTPQAPQAQHVTPQAPQAPPGYRTTDQPTAL